MRTYYIYKATNKQTGESYIGKTVDYDSRVWQHNRCYEKEDCKFHKAIQKYGHDGFDWEVLEACDDADKADSLERAYIRKYDSYRNGYNMNQGGVGGANARAVVCLTKDGEFVKRYDSAMAAEKEDGFCNSTVLLSCKAKTRTCKGHIFMFEDEYERYGAKTYQKPKGARTRSVVQCDCSGNLVNRFNSVDEASKTTGIRRSTISGALTGTYKRAGGYIFVYSENFPIQDMERYIPRKKGRKIAQVDAKSGEIIRKFDSVADAGRWLGVDYRNIHRALDVPNRLSHGYKWISQ